MKNLPGRRRPAQPFQLTVNASVKPDDPKSLTYASVIECPGTRIVSEHNSLAELRSFIHGIKSASAMLGYYIDEPRIPTIQDLVAQPQSFLPPSA